MTDKEKHLKTHDYELLLVDSPEYFVVKGAKMIFEGPCVRFICFDEAGNYKENIWFPMSRIHRIKRY